MTPERLKEIRERCANAHRYDGGLVSEVFVEDDLPELLAYVDELRADIKKMAERNTYTDREDYDNCIQCDRYGASVGARVEHAPDCLAVKYSAVKTEGGT